MKDLCAKTPILAYVDYRKPFQLQTYASDLGLGAILCQIDDSGHQRVIAYASHSLSNMERSYPAHKPEFLALKWAVTDRFHEYLYGGRFDVYTDNNPLTYILASAKLDATGQRWVASLANYDFRISNVEADALSCIPRTSDVLVDAPSVKAIINAIPYMDHTDYNYNPSDIVCKLTQMVVHKMSRDEWKVDQDNDSVIGPVIVTIKTKKFDDDVLSNGVKDYFIVGADCYSDVGCCTEKYLMDSYKRINSSLSYCSHTGNRLWRPAMIIWDTLV